MTDSCLSSPESGLSRRYSRLNPLNRAGRGLMRSLSALCTLSLVVGCSAAGEGREGNASIGGLNHPPALMPAPDGAAQPGEVGDGTGGPAAPGRASGAKAAACDPAWQARTKYTLSDPQSARANEMIPSVPRPKKGLAQPDPVYGNCVQRLTDHAEEPPRQFARHDYSRRQAFNADSSRILIASHDGSWHLYDANTLAWVKELDEPAGDAELQWHPTNPNLVYFQPTNGVGMVLYELDVETERVRKVADFSRRLRAIWPKANSAWTKAEGAPSADGRYWCFMVDDAAWRSLGIFVWDMEKDQILGTKSTHGDRPDHVSMSPGGSRCVVSSDSPGVGTRAWTRDFKQAIQLHHKSEHSDLAFDAKGREVYVSIDYQSRDGDVFMVDLESGQRTSLFKTYLNNSTTAVHFSGRAFKRPGWVLVSTYAADGAQEWLHEKIMAMSLTPNPSIRGLAYHHAHYNGYWTEPQATVNQDFTRVLFNSNWGSKSELDIDNYMISLKPNALD